MGVIRREEREVQARIVYFGASGAGTTANLKYIHRKLRREHRGELRTSPVKATGVAYEFLPVELGQVRGLATTLHVYTVPGGDECHEIRRRLLENADGVVFVADCRPDRHDATVAAAAELERHLASFGRSTADVILVLQYNHRDTASESALEKLHRRLRLNPTAVFEAAAHDGTGVLQTLTSLSKLILGKVRRDLERAEAAGTAAEQTRARVAEREPAVLAEESREFDAPLVEIEPAAPVALPSAVAPPPPSAPAAPEKAWRIESAGPVDGGDGELRVPVRIVDEASGRRTEIWLRLSLEAG
jgi:hypothetical protein